MGTESAGRKQHNSSATVRVRNLILAIATSLFLVLTALGLNIPGTVFRIMSEPASSPISQTIPLKVTLLEIPQSHPEAPTIVKLNVTIENTSSQPQSFLRWSSPLDTHAAAVGIFNFTSKSTHAQAPGINLKINHKYPDTGYFTWGDENIVHLKAGGKVDVGVEVKEHEVLLVRGEVYQVKATGRWMGVWTGEQERLNFEGSSGMSGGEFESENLELRIPG